MVRTWVYAARRQDEAMPFVSDEIRWYDSRSDVRQISNEQSLSTERLDLEDSVKNNGVDLNSQAGTQETDDNLEVASGSPLPGVKSNEQSLSTERLDLEDSVKNNGVDLNSQAGTQETDDNLEVASGSPLPGVKGGVLFKGNLRGQAAKSYEKITKRMQDRFGDQYKLFLLINPEDDRPVAVVVPKKVLQPETTGNYISFVVVVVVVVVAVAAAAVVVVVSVDSASHLTL
ncbi:zinc metalloprotease egy2 chloroplastic [Asimina triloba]